MKKWIAAAAVAAWAASSVFAQGTFPDKPLRMIIPFGAGSGVDANGRFFAEQLGGVLGQPVVVENKPGADGVIDMMAVKTAPADGYTLLLASNSSMTVNPLTIKDLPYDPLKDFKPISGLTRGMTVFIAPPESKIGNLADLVAAMKKSPAPMNVGTYSSGYRLAIEWFADLAGVKFTNVPYKGASAMFTDVIGGRLDWAVTDLVGAAELIRTGKVKPIAVSGDVRYPEFPNIPTIKESGYPAYVNYTWSSLSVRADTPPDVTAKLADALQKVFKQQATADFTKRAKVEMMAFTPAEMDKFQRAEIERLKKTADAAGITPE